MEEVKQILVVDDYFQMLEFLRSVLEFSHHEYQVLAVPSAEEGLLELRRTEFDLVITDVRLPGMSGFDLVRKVNDVKPNLPIIMITGYSSEQGKKEADELGVKRYFKKPLDPDELLATVHTVLYGTAEIVAESIIEPQTIDLSSDIHRRLETLRSDTGARHVMLSNAAGQILYDGGVGQELDLPTLVAGITDSMQASFRLADRLESPEPFTIQYQAGQKYDLYLANLGRDYFLAIFFDSQVRRGRLGTIWVFAQRAINDLEGLLAGQDETVLDSNVKSEEPAPSKAVTAEKKKPARESVVSAKKKATPENISPPVESIEEPANIDAEESDLETTQEMEPLTLADIQAYLGIESAGETEAVDLDSFWDDALEESGMDLGEGSGMSLEEARKQGLISTEFDDKERPKDQ